MAGERKLNCTKLVKLFLSCSAVFSCRWCPCDLESDGSQASILVIVVLSSEIFSVKDPSLGNKLAALDRHLFATVTSG